MSSGGFWDLFGSSPDQSGSGSTGPNTDFGSAFSPAAIAQALATGTTSSSKNPSFTYMGKNGPVTTTVTQFVADQIKAGQLGALGDTLKGLNYLTKTHWNANDVEKALASAATDFAAYQKSNPHSTIENYFSTLQGQVGPGVGGAGGGGSASGTITTIYQMSPDEAQYKLRSAMQQWLGRDPTSHEISSFTNAVNTAARNDPSTRTVDGTKGDKSVEVDKGFSPTYTSDNMALNAAKSSPDFASYQAVSTYYNALQSVLNDSVSGIGRGV